MEGYEAMKPVGPTVLLTASVAPSSAVQVSCSVSGKFFIFNSSSSIDAFLGVGTTSGAAAGNSVTPLNGIPSMAVPISHGPATGGKVITFFPNQASPSGPWFCAQTLNGQALVYITPVDTGV